MQTKVFKEPEHEAIALNAYLRWQAGGSHEGQSEANWFVAETELMQHLAAQHGTVWTRGKEDALSWPQ